LRDEEFVDVGQLFGFAQEQVPLLAKDIGGIQRPELKVPERGSFDIGRLLPQDQEAIILSQKRPLVLRPRLEREDQPVDVLGLTQLTTEALRARADVAKAAFFFVGVEQASGAYRIAGRYRITGSRISVTVYVYRGPALTGQFTVEGREDRLEELALEIVREVERHMPPAL
jgi:hypothetical protein